MEKFIVILNNIKGGSLNESLLAAHIAHLKQLDALNLLVLCGPFQDNDGALQILLADSMEEVEVMINDDPFIKEGYYQGYIIHELIEGNRDNNFLMDKK